MNTQKPTDRNARAAKAVLFFTGMLPPLMCWLFIISGTSDLFTVKSLPALAQLIVATLAYAISTHFFRRRRFAWIYNELPVYGSFVSALTHLAYGFGTLVVVFGPYQIYDYGFLFFPGLLFFALVASVIALPGVIVGFYINAHLFIYLKTGRFSLHKSSRPRDW